MPLAAGGTATGVPGKKTTAASREKASRELVRTSVPTHFRRAAQNRPTRSGGRGNGHSLHRPSNWATTLTELLRFQPPHDDHRTVLCACGHASNYAGMRFRPILWAGHVTTARHREDGFLPGVRRRLAAVGSEAPFVQGREQLKPAGGSGGHSQDGREGAESIGADLEAGSNKA